MCYPPCRCCCGCSDTICSEQRRVDEAQQIPNWFWKPFCWLNISSDDAERKDHTAEWEYSIRGNNNYNSRVKAAVITGCKTDVRVAHFKTTASRVGVVVVAGGMRRRTGSSANNKSGLGCCCCCTFGHQPPTTNTVHPLLLCLPAHTTHNGSWFANQQCSESNILLRQ